MRGQGVRQIPQWIELARSTERGRRLVDAPQVGEHDSKLQVSKRVTGIQSDRLPVRRFRGPPVPVEPEADQTSRRLSFCQIRLAVHGAIPACRASLETSAGCASALIALAA